MLKKTITYENWDGVEVTEDLYFNLTKSELLFWEAEEEGGLQKKLEQITASKDNREIMRYVKQLVLTAYGKKSPDGRHFVKNDQVRAEFESSAAFDAFMTELLLQDDSADAVNAFVIGIMPKLEKPNAGA